MKTLTQKQRSAFERCCNRLPEPLMSDKVNYLVTTQGNHQDHKRHENIESARTDARSRLKGKGEVVDWSVKTKASHNSPDTSNRAKKNTANDQSVLESIYARAGESR